LFTAAKRRITRLPPLTDGDAHRDAISGGYTPSMYAWEVGWADIAIGALGAACARQALRGQWMTAAVAVLAISFGGDAIGHIVAWNAHGDTAAANVWAIPADVVQAGLAVLLLIIYRRLQGSAENVPLRWTELIGWLVLIVFGSANSSDNGVSLDSHTAEPAVSDAASADKPLDVIEKDHRISQDDVSSIQRSQRILAVRDNHFADGEHVPDYGGCHPGLAHHGRTHQQHRPASFQAGTYLDLNIPPDVGESDDRPVHPRFKTRIGH
jgi:hypothetical protein